MLKKELKLQRKTIAVYEDRLTKVMNNEVKLKKTLTAEQVRAQRCVGCGFRQVCDLDVYCACSDEQLACQMCGKMFATPAYLNSHMSRRHGMFPGANPMGGMGNAYGIPGMGMPGMGGKCRQQDDLSTLPVSG